MNLSNSDQNNTRREEYRAMLKGCYEPYVRGWSPKMNRAVGAAVMDGAGLTEPQLTGLYAALDYDSALPMTSLIEKRVGQAPGKRIPDKPKVKLARINGSRKMIDGALVGHFKGDIVPPIFLEFKLDGAVNGGLDGDYCQEHHGYGNQVICYPAGCFWAFPEEGHFMVWIGLRKHVESALGYWGTKGINETDVMYSRFGVDTAEHFRRQSEAKWDAGIALEDLACVAKTGNLASQTFGRIIDQTVQKFGG